MGGVWIKLSGRKRFIANRWRGLADGSLEKENELSGVCALRFNQDLVHSVGLPFEPWCAPVYDELGALDSGGRPGAPRTISDVNGLPGSDYL